MKALKWLDNYLEEVLMTGMLIGIASIMIIQVISRYVFNYSLSWSDELARYLLVWSCFLSVSYCVKRRISIKITQVQNALPPGGQTWMKLVRHTIVFIFCILMIPFSLDYVQQAVANGSTSAAMQIPMYYMQSAPLVGFILLAIRVAEAWVREFRETNLWKNRHPLAEADGPATEAEIEKIEEEIEEKSPEAMTEIISDAMDDENLMNGPKGTDESGERNAEKGGDAK